MLRQQANASAEEFSWAMPKLHKVRRYCKDILGWTIPEVIIQPWLYFQMSRMDFDIF